MALLSRALSKSYPLLVFRSFHVSQSTPAVNESKFLFNLSGYNKYGLLADDLITETSPEVIEAIRRLPEEEKMQRIHRAIRAHQAELNHSILPEDQWTNYEDNHHYLKPYIEEVKKEKEEMEEWEANH